MTIRFPRQWADQYGFLWDRVDVDEAIAFVRHLQSYEFGTLIETHNMNADAGRDPDDDPAMQSERELQDDLDTVLDWLRDLQSDGQETISTNKVQQRIEDETGFDVEFTG